MSLLAVALCAACGAGTPGDDNQTAANRGEVAAVIEVPTVAERRPGILNGDDPNTIFGLQEAIQTAERNEATDVPGVVDQTPDTAETPEPNLGAGNGDTEAPVVEEPAAEEPVTETPVTEEPVAETPVTETPVIEEPVAETPVTEEPAAEEPVTETPVIEEPVAEESVTETPVTEEPVAEAPVTETPVIEEPVAEEPVTETPVIEEPVAEEPVAETPVTEEPVAEAPVTETPVIEEPVAEEPVTETPVAEEPVAEAPVTETPVTEEPVAEAPVTETPVIEEPVAEAPVTETPVTEEPVAEAPFTESPVIDEPVAEEPVTETPVAEEPVAEAPVTETPVTEEPVAEAPVTESPATEEPVAEEPVTETPVAEEPVTEAPVTETPVTEEPAAEAPVTETPVTEEPVAKAPVMESPVIEEPVAEEPATETPVAEEPVAETPVAETPTTEEPVAEGPATETPDTGAATPDTVPVDADGDGVTDSDTTNEPDPVDETGGDSATDEPTYEETVATIDEPTDNSDSEATIEDLLDAMNTEENVSSSYSEIQSGGLDNACYMDADHYVAEFLYQNPEVCFWEVDESAQTVKAIPTPVVPDNAIPLPVPSGGDDTAALESIINSNAGKAVVGRGVYKVRELDINVKIDIFDMPMVPTSNAEEMVQINASDVRIFNSPIDAKGSNRTNIGFKVNNGSDRFVLVNSGFSNIHHKEKRNAAGVFIRGADDFHLACNRFVNIVNDDPSRKSTARANAIWMNGSNRETTAGGVVVNNYAEDFQSNGKLKDAEFFTEQNYKSTSESRPTLVMANRGLNAGKRLTKHQSDNAKVLSNYYEWREKNGPLGTRLLLSHVEVQFSSNIIARNNRMLVDAEGRYDYIFFADSKLNRGVQDNLHYDCNDVEFIQKHNKDGGSRPQLITIRSSDKPKKGTGMAPTNSSANYNRFHGTGSVRWYYWFGEGVEDRGGIFDYTGNVFEIPYEVSKYKDP